MGEDSSRLVLPGSARQDFEAARAAYDAWVGADEDDFFDVDEIAELSGQFRVHIGSAIEKSLLAGVEQGRIVAAMTAAFPLASDVIAEGLDYVDLDDAGSEPSPLVGFVPSVSAATRDCPQCGAVTPFSADFCAKCGHALPELAATDLLPLISELQRQLEQRLGRPDLPQTGLLSENFMTRAFTVYGHALVAGLIVTLPIYLMYLILFASLLNSR